MTIEKALALESIEDLLNEVKERRAQQSRMVGSLYPGILESEIDLIYTRINELQEIEKAIKRLGS